MITRIRQGAQLETATPAEVEAIVQRANTKAQFTRVRASASAALNAAGATITPMQVYKIPAGYEFAARRVMVNINTAAGPGTGNVPLTAGAFITYQRSGTLIAYGQPAYGSTVQVPGAETWGDEQGPYLRNGEYFEVVAAGLTASAQLVVYLQGILYRPTTRDDGDAASL